MLLKSRTVGLRLRVIVFLKFDVDFTLRRQQ